MVRFAILFLLVLSCATMEAQESRGSLTGRVSDPTGAPVPDAHVRLRDTQTGAASESTTNDAGSFTASFLLPSFYTVSVEHAGFRTLTRDNVQVRIGDVVQLDLQLALGDVSQNVTVSAETPLLETGTASLGQVVGSQQLSELPIASGNVAELVTLAPGVSSGSAIAIHKAAFNAGTSSIVADGNAINSNEWTIDGVPNMFASGSVPRIAFSPPATTIREFKTETTFYDAAMGHTSGAIFNMSTASGTNDLHGEAHEFFGNSALNSNDFFANRNGQRKQSYQDNRYGGAIGGPVVIPKLYNGKNKTFFYYAFEGNKWGMPQTYTGTVPTDAERHGDFSALLALGPQYQIYDPFTTFAVGSGKYGRSPVLGNIIPGAELNTTGLKLLSYFPEPNATGSAGGINNYVLANISGKESYYAHFARVDHSFSERDRFFARIDYDHWNELKNLYFGPANPANGYHNMRVNRGLALDNVYTVSPSTILDVRYGLTQQSFPGQPASTDVSLSALGFSSNLVSQIASANPTFPDTKFTSFSELGPSAGLITNTSLIHTLTGSMTTLIGDHNLHYGIDLRVNRAFQAPYATIPSPYLTFDSAYTNGPLSTSPSAPIGQDLAALLFGIPQGYAVQNASFADQDTWFGLFLQDDWRITSKLTLNLGLRLEHETPVNERYNRSVTTFAADAVNPIASAAIANYAANPMPGLPVSSFHVLGGLHFAGPNNRSLWQGQSAEWMPRIALAWQITPKTVIRTGFGLFYDTIGTYRSPSIQTGFSSTTPIIPSYDNGLTYAATLSNPFPNGLQPITGAAGGLSTALGQNLSVYPNYRPIPYSERWSFGIQQQFPGGFVLDASYVGNHGLRLPTSRQIDAIPNSVLSTLPYRDNATIAYLSQQFPNPFYGLNSVYTKTVSRASLLTPYPEFSGVTEIDSDGFSNYHSLQAQLTRRFSHGYTVNIAYTFSKMMDGTQFLNAGDPVPWYGISTYDRPERIAVSGVWDLPIGRKRMLGTKMPTWLDAAIGGWEITTVITFQSGDPLTWGNALFNGSIKDIPLAPDQRSVDGWFNTQAGFVTASSQQPLYNLRTFPLRLANVRGDSQNVWNISLVKNFQIYDRLRLQLRGEGYNALNHPNLSDPSVNVTSSGFGRISSMDGYGREITVAARLIF